MFPLKWSFLMDNNLYFFLFATYSYKILNRLINFRKEKRKEIHSIPNLLKSKHAVFLYHKWITFRVGVCWGSVLVRHLRIPEWPLCCSPWNRRGNYTLHVSGEFIWVTDGCWSSFTEAVAWRIVKGQNASFAVIFKGENMTILYLKCLLQKLIRL